MKTNFVYFVSTWTINMWLYSCMCCLFSSNFSQIALSRSAVQVENFPLISSNKACWQHSHNAILNCIQRVIQSKFIIIRFYWLNMPGNSIIMHCGIGLLFDMLLIFNNEKKGSSNSNSCFLPCSPYIFLSSWISSSISNDSQLVTTASTSNEVRKEPGILVWLLLTWKIVYCLISLWFAQ